MFLVIVPFTKSFQRPGEMRTAPLLTQGYERSKPLLFGVSVP